MLSLKYRREVCDRRERERQRIPIDPATGLPVGLNVCKFVIDLRCPVVPADYTLRWGGEPIEWGGSPLTWGAPRP